MKHRLAPFALATAATLLALTGCGDPEPEARESASQQAEMKAALEAMGPRDVLIEVEAVKPHEFNSATGKDPSAMVTLTGVDGTEQGTYTLPLQNKTGTSGVTRKMDAGEIVSMSAQLQEGAAGVLCRISVDDEVVAEKSSSGRYSVASCVATIE
ncbi:hypothetical protein [Citricoccus sp. K5]|uniref:hypothetical protein n=1 Tax=Citricoccus sp. K5 TaxID=2653135 RepID=UPI0012F0E50F|nr:hypothetical protein [Citricoccus sp. K5]VXA93724.1 exported hypothetical protein [Citricoccus sp. K5]VXA96539.1 exported hypothetical protein [Citricoccus sp. K5]